MNQPVRVRPASAAADDLPPPVAPGRRLHEIRKKRGVSLDKLAEGASYTKGYLSKIETGEKPLTADAAKACDRVLQTGGELTRLVQALQDSRQMTGDGTADVCPYPGLASFQPQDAAWFYGRERATASLVDRLAGNLRDGGLAVVVAPSGAGKSSLLRAGLVPELRRGALPAYGSRHWPVSILTPGQRPLEALLDTLQQTTHVPKPLAHRALARGGHSLNALLRSRWPFPGPVSSFARSGEQTPPVTRPVLIIDQFEELFTLCEDDTERDEFLSAVRALAVSARPDGRGEGPAALVVLGIRADYYGHCLAYPGLAAHMESGHLPLGPMSPDELCTAITGPADRAGLVLQPGLTEVILRDIGAHRASSSSNCSAEALPLLAHALRATWQQRTDNILTVHGYERTGGIHGAIEASAERAYRALPQAARQALPPVLLNLVHLDQGNRATRRHVTQPPLANGPDPAAVQTAVDAFTQARLLTLDADHVTIAHEALLTAWPRLSQWITDDRDGLRTRQQLTDAADNWEHSDRAPDLLHRGARLAVAEEWAEQHPGTAEPLVKEFLQASRDQAYEEQRLERRHVRRLRHAVVALSALLVVTVTSLAFAYCVYDRAQNKEAQAFVLAARAAEREARLRRDRLEAQVAEELSRDLAYVHCSKHERCIAVGGRP